MTLTSTRLALGVALAILATGCTGSTNSGPLTTGAPTSSTSEGGSSGGDSTTSGEGSSSGEASTSSGVAESSGGSAETSSGSSSGGESETDGGTAFAEPRTYRAFWPESEEECAQQQASGVNCYYEVSFCPDGRSAVIWTDIQAAGEYELAGEEIIASWADAEFSPVTFSLDPADDSLSDSVFMERWERDDRFPIIECD